MNWLYEGLINSLPLRIAALALVCRRIEKFKIELSMFALLCETDWLLWCPPKLESSPWLLSSWQATNHGNLPAQMSLELLSFWRIARTTGDFGLRSKDIQLLWLTHLQLNERSITFWLPRGSLFAITDCEAEDCSLKEKAWTLLVLFLLLKSAAGRNLEARICSFNFLRSFSRGLTGCTSDRTGSEIWLPSGGSTK